MVNEAKQKPPRRYEKMRDSGVAWIGMVPEGWNVTRIKRHFKITTGNGFRPDLQGKQNGDYPVCKASDIAAAGKTLTCSANYISTATQQAEHFNVIPTGSILIPKIGEAMKKNHRTIAVLDCCLDNNCQALTPTGISTVYAYYLFLCIDMNWVDNGGTIPCINNQQLKDLKIPLPEYVTQIQIVRYLDEKCRKIDDAIAEAKASVEEYKAWKVSIIYEAVTKGLDPHAEMKDSGVEWIGEIPEEWYVCKTLFVLQMPITDGPHTTPELYAAGVPFVSAEAVSCGNGRIDFNHIRGYISEGFYQECCKKYIPQKDDIYMIKSGATTGKVAIVDVDTKFTIWSPLAAFRVNPKKVLPRYLFYFLQSPAYQKQVELGWSFGTQQNIGMRTLEKLKICVPPLSVQQEIIRYLDEKSKKLDAIIKEKTDLISDLESYKKSLIYEVVTGKRKVC